MVYLFTEVFKNFSLFFPYFESLSSSAECAYFVFYFPETLKTTFIHNNVVHLNSQRHSRLFFYFVVVEIFILVTFSLEDTYFL